MRERFRSVGTVLFAVLAVAAIIGAFAWALWYQDSLRVEQTGATPADPRAS